MTQHHPTVRPVLAVADDKPWVHDAIRARMGRRFIVQNAGHRLADVDDYIAREMFDVIVLELCWRDDGSVMPWIRRWIRQNPELRIVVISAHAGTELATAAIAAGASAWVSMSMPLAALASALQEVLSGRRGVVVEPLSALIHGKEEMSRRWQILDLLGTGWRYKEIADCLHIQPGTIEYHVGLLKRDLGIASGVRVNWRAALERALQDRSVIS